MIQRLLPCLLVAALAAAAAPMRADNDAVHFGTNIYVAPNSTVHDAVCFFCNVNAEGTVKGDVVVFFGSVRLAGNAEHDVVDFFGGVDAEDGAAVGRDLVSFFGMVQLGDDVSVGHDLVALMGSFRAADSVNVGNDRVVQPGWILDFPLIAMIILLLFAVREYRLWRRRQLYRGYPYYPPPY